MQYRRGESASKTWYRSDRLFCLNGQWFFSTRENINMGPFASRAEAEIELAQFIRHVSDGRGLYLSQYDQSFLTSINARR